MKIFLQKTHSYYYIHLATLLLLKRIFDIKVIPLSKNPRPFIMRLSGSKGAIFVLYVMELNKQNNYASTV